MSTTTSRVKGLLDEMSARDANGDGDSKHQRMTRSELKEAVREGVSEALEEQKASAETDSEEESETETESEAETETDVAQEGGSNKGKGVVAVLTVAALLVLFRRLRGSSQTE